MYGDHIVISPFRRWCILSLYWLLVASVVVPRGYLEQLLEQEWKPLNAVYVASLIINVGVFLSLWTFGAYSFNRPWSLFSTIVYPLGHIMDSLMWYAIFDLGKYMTIPYSQSPSNMLKQYIAGYLLLSIVIFLHRKTFELWYLPEHHPPRSVRGELYYVMAAVASSIFFTVIYHWFGDLRWCVLLKYVVDLYCCIRMRMPAPWIEYSHKHDKQRDWDWAGF